MDTGLIAKTHDGLTENRLSNALFRLRAASFDPGFLARHIEDVSDAPTGKVSVLDVGCNQGYKTDLILETVEQLGARVERLLGMDVSPVCINKAQDRNMHPNVSYEVGNFLDSSLAPNSFDYVFLFAVWHHIENTRAAVEKVKGVLKPNGLGLVLNTFYPENRFLQMPAEVLQRLYRYIECRGSIPYEKPLVSSTVDEFEAGGLPCKGVFQTNFPTNIFNTQALVFQKIS